MGRRLPLLVVSLLWLAAASAAGAQTPAQSIGIRLLDAPTSRTDDPRARIYVVDHLAPGTTINRRVEVSNDTDKAQTIQLYAGAATIADGNIQFGAGRATNELTGWTKVDPASLNLASRARGVATVTIAVPANASAGERYAVVWAEVSAAAPAGGGIAAVNRVGVRVYLSVGPGGEPPTDFAITALEARRAPDGSPQVAATVHNTGGRAVDLSGELRLANGPGGLSAGPFDAKLGTTLGLDQTEPVLVTLDPAVPKGPWDARIVLRSGVTEREAAATLTFPDAPDSAAGPAPVRRGTGGGGVPVLPIGIGAGVAALLVAVVVMAGRRRTRTAP